MNKKLMKFKKKQINFNKKQINLSKKELKWKKIFRKNLNKLKIIKMLTPSYNKM